MQYLRLNWLTILIQHIQLEKLSIGNNEHMSGPDILVELITLWMRHTRCSEKVSVLGHAERRFVFPHCVHRNACVVNGLGKLRGGSNQFCCSQFLALFLLKVDLENRIDIDWVGTTQFEIHCVPKAFDIRRIHLIVQFQQLLLQYRTLFIQEYIDLLIGTLELIRIENGFENLLVLREGVFESWNREFWHFVFQFEMRIEIVASAIVHGGVER
mmetsp:Transcript_9375/g.34746  ORF Transcript_9375/g.34746 Transcript_9375/m.34746 type:complete len:213 (+) Transcript_9375:1190-1828(+)